MRADSNPPDPADPLARLAGQRERLQHVTSSLAASLDPQAVAERILETASGLLAAPQGWVAVVGDDGATARILAARGYEAEVIDRWMEIPLTLDVPLTAAINSGQVLVHRSRAERHAEFPAIPTRASAQAEAEASVVYPLAFEGRTTGAIGLSFLEERDFDEDEVWLLESMAAQAAQALERARLFAALRERDERLRFALSASGTGTWTWELGSDRLEWSPEIGQIHGTDPDWVPASLEAYLELVHPDDRERVEAAVRGAARDRGHYEAEFRVVRPDGGLRWVLGVGRVKTDEAGRPVQITGTANDITARRLAEEARDRYIEAEREAARLRDAFIGVVSHELRTPITTIFGGTRVLARRWREMPPETRDEILADVVEEADRLYRLVEDLLVLTRVERRTLEISDEPVNLGRLLERVTASERARWPEVSFVLDVAGGLPTIVGEDTYVEQILRNLLGNAAKYGGPGTTVTVLAAAEAADQVSITVLDEGPGIDEDEVEELFELFYRSPSVSASVAGAGIGLFVCRRLVEAMGGTIRARRRPEGGARFTVTLPRTADDETG